MVRSSSEGDALGYYSSASQAASALINTICVLALILCSVLAISSAIAAKDDPSADARLIRKGMSVVDLLAKSKFDSVGATFDATMKDLLPAEKVSEVWKSLQTRYGAYKATVGSRIEEVSGYKAVFIAIQFDQGRLDAKIVFNAEEKVIGLFFVPSSAQSPSFDAPSYADESAFTETDFTVTTDDFKLPGTLALPKTPPPYTVVVLIAGSGPNDRDETIGPNKVFRDLAWGLASRGIASLRYDKRTKVYGMKLDVKELTYKEEVVDDAISAIKQLRKDDRVDRNRVFLLGHSLGGQLVPAIAHRARSGGLGSELISVPSPSFSEAVPLPGGLPFTRSQFLAGAIIMAGSARPIAALMADQLNHIAMSDGQVTLQERSTILEFQSGVDALLAGKDPNATPVMGLTYTYLQALNNYDCLKAAQKSKLPLFVVQGERDYQVLAQKDYQAWQDALKDRNDATFHLYPKLNHLFIEGEGESYPSEYEIPGHVSEEFVKDLAEWIKKAAEGKK